MNSIYKGGHIVENMENADRPDWLTEMDEEILDVLSTNLVLSPSIIAENIDRSREGVSNRLNSLQAGGLVEKVDRGKYEITDEGVALYIGKDEFEKSDWYSPERIGWKTEEIDRLERIGEELGITRKEFQTRVRKEYDSIIKNNPEVDDPLKEAEKRVQERLKNK